MDLQERDWADALRAERAGNRVAYANFLREFAIVVRRLVRRKLVSVGMSAQEAEDIVQEVLLAVHAKRDQWNSTRPLLPWLFAISRYKIIDAVRRRRSELRLRVNLREEEWSLLLIDEEESNAVTPQAVDRLVSELPPVQQSVVHQIGIEGLSPKQAASHLGMKEGTVRVAFHRGLAKLAELARGRIE